MISLDRKKFCKYSFDGYCYCPNSNRCNRTCYLFDDCRHFDYSAVAKRFPQVYAAVRSVDWWLLASVSFLVFCDIGLIELCVGSAPLISFCGLILEMLALILACIWHIGRKLYLTFKANYTVIKESCWNGRE